MSEVVSSNDTLPCLTQLLDQGRFIFRYSQGGLKVFVGHAKQIVVHVVADAQQYDP